MGLSNGLRSSLIGVHHEPKSLSPSLNLFHLASVHIAPANKPCAAVHSGAVREVPTQHAERAHNDQQRKVKP